MRYSETDSLPDDATLALRVQAAAGGDPEAEAALCRRLGPRVRLYGLRHLGNGPAADDLAQQVLLLLIERLRAGAVKDPQRLAGFVFGICRQVVMDQRRGQARRDRLLACYGDALRPPEPPAPFTDQARLARCLEQLPDRERTVLLLTFYDDMPAAALAAELELSQANVRVIRHRALRRLRGCVSGEQL